MPDGDQVYSTFNVYAYYVQNNLACFRSQPAVIGYEIKTMTEARKIAEEHLGSSLDCAHKRPLEGDSEGAPGGVIFYQTDENNIKLALGGELPIAVTILEYLE